LRWNFLADTSPVSTTTIAALPAASGATSAEAIAIGIRRLSTVD
jgi:hypothetical protein